LFCLINQGSYTFTTDATNIAAQPALKIVVLDTRYFRDDLDITGLDPSGLVRPYCPFLDTLADPPPGAMFCPLPDDDPRSILGEEQWTWLEEELAATPLGSVVVIGSSIQFLHSYNGWESWNNMPREKRRLMDLLKDYDDSLRIVVVSGDVHWNEVSMDEGLYDFTSSGITHIDKEIDINLK